ncbi:MAG: class I SAM-dependent methyltransferase [Coleofasciculus sp. D1-CHI-01]|uniref:class I SAM-dependent methyltransferase n=1 Tax=Coleofasciculus sp. D1-CHI-01 TaxID=3068482 RepID=UPI0032F7E8EF
MMTDKDSASVKVWCSGIKDAYTLEQRKHWYSDVANVYDQARPRYPKTLIHRAVKLARLPAKATILEIGCGPGIATVEFAELGFSMVCLEPSPAACKLAKSNCSAYPNVEIINTTFEEWQLEPGRFNAILAATSMHWVAPEIRVQKSAEALQNKGSIIMLWNTPPHPNDEICHQFDEVYQTQAPSIPKFARYGSIETHQANLKEIEQDFTNSGLFHNFLSEQLVCHTTHSIDEYLTLLSTISPYIKLESRQRMSLFSGLRDVLERTCTGRIKTSYLSALQIAQVNHW